MLHTHIFTTITIPTVVSGDIYPCNTCIWDVLPIVYGIFCKDLVKKLANVSRNECCQYGELTTRQASW